MMKNNFLLLFIVFFVGSSFLLTYGCVTPQRQVSNSISNKEVVTSQYVTEKEEGWIKYRLYCKPWDKKNKDQIIISLRVINIEDNTSPLRRISNSIEAYSTYYEYLLNSAKNDFLLKVGANMVYPKWFAFENNYNAFPFEVMNIGFEDEALNKRNDPLTLVFTDKVFSHSIISLEIKK